MIYILHLLLFCGFYLLFRNYYVYHVRTYFIDKDWKYYHTLPSYDDMLFKYPFKWNYKKEYIKTIKL